MNKRQPRWTRRGLVAAMLFFLAILLIPLANARAVTFGDWATGMGWPTGHVMADSVNATWYGLIDSLAGTGNYDWTTTPTTYLNLSCNQITSIESGDFAALGKLTELYLHTNRITSIESGDFAGLENLTSLGLADNQITGIESGDFAGLDNLTGLALRFNQITSIESGDFAGLGSLVELDLESNQITSIEPGDFAGLDNLTGLYLYGNQITSIEPGDFAGLDRLTTLWLSANPITSIDSGDFTGLENLTALHLSSTAITNIESGALANVDRLTDLYLDNNDALTNLNLNETDLTCLSTFNLKGDTGISHVSLRNTRLNDMSLTALVNGGYVYYGHIGIGELPGITELDLSCVDFSAIFAGDMGLWPLEAMDSLTDIWLVDVRNMNAYALDDLLDNLAAMEDPSIEGTLYMTQADFDTLNAAGGGKLAIWDAEAGHHVEIIGLGDANADGLVDDADAAILATHWHQADGANWFDGDFNGDGAVNDVDASILAAHWLQGVENLPSSIPEPGAFAMLAGALASLGVLRRRGR